MAQIKIYGHADLVEANRQPILDAIHASVVVADIFRPRSAFMVFSHAGRGFRLSGRSLGSVCLSGV